MRSPAAGPIPELAAAILPNGHFLPDEILTGAAAGKFLSAS